MRRPILWLLLALGVVIIALADLTAAAVVVLGGVVLAMMIRFRGRGVIRVALVGLTAGLTMVGLVAALAVPRYQAGNDPLLVAQNSSQNKAGLRQGNFDLSGYVVTDNDNATNSVDAQGASLTAVIASGGLVNPDGTFQYSGVQNALIHANLAGARGELLVQNYDPAASNGAGNFSTALGEAVLATDASRRLFASQVAAVVKQEHWNGVTFDFEQLKASDEASYVALMTDMRAALPASAKLAVAVPVQSPAWSTYDLAGLAKVVDIVNLMTYDQHDPTGPVGPVGTLSWIKDAAIQALASVPASKLQLGVPQYGYSWGPSSAKIGSSFSAAQGRAIAASNHVTPVWDPASAEWTVKLPDGTVLWWADAKTMSAIVKLAQALRLEGAAIWEMSIADPFGAVSASLPLERTSITVNSARQIDKVPATGLVALTFDDGPDPTWTPQILSVLAKEGVPGTFFDIGMNAQANPDLVNQEVANGNVVGNHTYSHLDLTQIPLWRAKLEIAAGSWVLHGITGRTPMLFRSPYGASELADANTDDRRDLATSLGMQPVGWNVDPQDWSKPGVSQIVNGVVNQQGSNLIVLLHDGGGDRSHTVAALPQIIEKLKARGYKFVTADQMDGTITNVYQPEPQGFTGIAFSLLSIASFRLWASGHTVVIWTMIVLGLLSMIRILLSWPLASSHRRRARKNERALDLDLDERSGDSSLRLGATSRHSVSILIPAHNEEATLAKTINALNQVRGRIEQIIVVENGSTDFTVDVARRCALANPSLPITVRELGPVGKAAALNACLPEVTGDVVIVLDADTVLDPAFIESVLPHFNDSRVGAVAGNVKVGNRRKLLARLQSLEYIMSLAIDRRAQARLNVVSVVPGAAGAFRRDALIRAQGWPSRTLTEDTDLTVALLSAGWQVPYEPAAISWTEAPESVRDVMRQRRRWSYGAAQVSSLHSHRMLDFKEGRVGLLALPWLVVAQVILPAAAPIVDAYLIWLVLNGDWSPAVGMLALAIAAEMALAVWALRSDHESLKQLWLVPVARFVWKPLMLVAVSGSLSSWLTGRSIHWRQIRRRNSVDVPGNTLNAGAHSERDPASGPLASGPMWTDRSPLHDSSQSSTNLLAPIRPYWEDQEGTEKQS